MYTFQSFLLVHSVFPFQRSSLRTKALQFAKGSYLTSLAAQPGDTSIVTVQIPSYMPTAFPLFDLGMLGSQGRKIASASLGNEASKAAVTSPSHPGIRRGSKAQGVHKCRVEMGTRFGHVNCCQGAAGIFPRGAISFSSCTYGEALLILKSYMCVASYTIRWLPHFRCR